MNNPFSVVCKIPLFYYVCQNLGGNISKEFVELYIKEYLLYKDYYDGMQQELLDIHFIPEIIVHRIFARAYEGIHTNYYHSGRLVGLAGKILLENNVIDKEFILNNDKYFTPSVVIDSLYFILDDRRKYVLDHFDEIFDSEYERSYYILYSSKLLNLTDEDYENILFKYPDIRTKLINYLNMSKIFFEKIENKLTNIEKYCYHQNALWRIHLKWLDDNPETNKKVENKNTGTLIYHKKALLNIINSMNLIDNDWVYLCRKYSSIKNIIQKYYPEKYEQYSVMEYDYNNPSIFAI